MADTKTTALTELASGAIDDLDVAPVVDVSDTTQGASGTLKKFKWSSIKATLKTYLDTLYLSLTGGTLAGGTVTASAPVLTVTQTFNNAGVTFVGKSNEFTDTASGTDTILEQWKVGGTAKAWIRKDGTAVASWFRVNLASGVPGAPLIQNHVSGINYLGVDDPINGGASVVGVTQGAGIGFGATSYFNGTFDVVLRRDAADALAQRRGTNAQTFRNYGTYTDASNYRRVQLSMTTAGVAELKPEGAGTGASGNVLHISGLPTSNPGPGILWNNAGSVAIGT